MKLITTFLVSMVVTGIALAASARDYHDLVAEGYRWVKIDGPYACATKEDLVAITRDPSDLNELHMVSHGEPVHNRAAYERALELPPWDG
jgi:hypothetical protein